MLGIGSSPLLNESHYAIPQVPDLPEQQWGEEVTHAAGSKSISLLFLFSSAMGKVGQFYLKQQPLLS